MTAPVAQGFVPTIAALRYGLAAEQLDTELRKLIKDCRESGRPGSLTLTLTVKPGKADALLELVDDIKVKPPKLDKGSTLMWATHDGGLARNDPRQGDLNLRPVTAVEKIDADSGEIVQVAKG